MYPRWPSQCLNFSVTTGDGTGTKLKAVGPALCGGLEGIKTSERGGNATFLFVKSGCDDVSLGCPELS